MLVATSVLLVMIIAYFAIVSAAQERMGGYEQGHTTEPEAPSTHNPGEKPKDKTVLQRQ